MSGILGVMFLLFVFEAIWKWLLEPIFVWMGDRIGDLVEYIAKRWRTRWGK